MNNKMDDMIRNKFISSKLYKELRETDLRLITSVAPLCRDNANIAKEFKRTILLTIVDIFNLIYSVNGLGSWTDDFKNRIIKSLTMIDLVKCMCSDLFDKDDVEILISHLISRFENTKHSCEICKNNGIYCSEEKTPKQTCMYYKFEPLDQNSDEIKNILSRNLEKCTPKKSKPTEKKHK